MTDANPRAVMGGNNPPIDPHEAMLSHVGDLFETAQGFLDGEPITNQATADMVGKLIDEARTARNDAEALRKAEAKPFDDGKKAVQAKWTPITDEKTGKCALIISTAKKALTPWLEHLEAEQRKIADAARQEAEQARLKALEAERAAQSSDDLEIAEKAAQAAKEARIIEAQANKADKAKPQAAGGARSIGLRTSWRAEVTDYGLLLAHYKKTQPNRLKAWLHEQAQADVRLGARDLPGVIAHEERNAA